ncbi:DUF5343 domain-containing protein [Pseudomonas sp. RIT778]|uniref:DUF5343 domain-containing protein n=1 Tax=unclassified Pseudomonas TaxID=196821 RepID=UPI001C86985F|nr:MULTISPECIES: DUF5343 domain-containing protein [unclassified Pseudomonas]MBX8469725.1 DUF5343 domain-containing protein [Pseudomonas sp. RIT778]MCH4899602.1 hypothetical protein [Pseudomonas sp. B707]
MAKNYPAFVNATSAVSKILEKIKVAATPDRFTQDYLATELGFPGGGARAFIPLAKKLGLLGSDGTPTDLYRQFRNTNAATSKAAMAKAIKNAYSDVYARNEYAHSLSRADFEGLVVEMTGLEKGNGTVKAIVSTFEALKAFAEFKAVDAEEPIISIEKKISESSSNEEYPDVRLGLSYTINLVLPKTDDVSVFNAIFRSLRENLLRK